MKLEFCAVCGYCDDAEKLEFHHFIPKSEGGSDDETNLLTLCFSCHGSIHGMFRKNIKELTRKGLERAKASGKKLGSPNPRKGGAVGALVVKKNAYEYAENLRNVIEEIISIEKKVSLREIASELMRRQIRTPRGGEVWLASQVSNLLLTLKIVTCRRRNESE